MTTTIRHGPFTIRRSNPELVPLELRPYTFCASNIVTWTLWVAYISVQFYAVNVVQYGSSRLLWQMWLLLITEFCLSFQEVVLGINLIFALFFAAESRTRPRYLLIGDSAPTVDVFIPCCGEQVDIISDTVSAVIAQDYPPEQLRVIVLDDGHDPALRSAVTLLGETSKQSRGPIVHYMSRDTKPGVASFFKAGNLQFGIDESKQLGGSEFMASLDADMIPEEDWLRRMLPHLLLSGDVGLACPPQGYYNVPDYDPLGQKSEFDLWFSVYEPLNDRLDSAMCTGSGFIVRRSALEDIGGWPQAVAGEDVMCSSVLSSNGWKVAFIREDLQSGLAPNSLRSHIRQRMRWVDAAIEVHKQFGFYISGSKTTLQLTWTQRVVGLLWALREYAPLTNVLALVLLPLASLLYWQDGVDLVTLRETTRWTWGSFLAYYFAKKVNNYIMFSHVGLRRVMNFQSLDVWGSPYTSFRCLVSLLPSAQISTFEVSGSTMSAVNERSALHRKPLPSRLLSFDMLMYFFYVTYASTPLILRLFTSRETYQPLDIIIVFPGSTLKLLDCIAKASVPLWYMTFPPTVPERETLMTVDGKGVRRPKKINTGNRTNLEWYTVMDLCSICLMWWYSA